MSAYKQFTTKDIVITPFSANKGFRYTGNALTASNVGVEIYFGTQPPTNKLIFEPTTNHTYTGYLSGVSASQNSTGFVNKLNTNSIYSSAMQLYYSNYFGSMSGSLVASSSLLYGLAGPRNNTFANYNNINIGLSDSNNMPIGAVQTPAYDNYLSSTIPQLRAALLGEQVDWAGDGSSDDNYCTVVSIPSKLWGQNIEPQSFNYNIVYNLGGNDINIWDDGNGILKYNDAGNSLYNQYCGNIIYEHGIAIFTPVSESDPTVVGTDTTASATMGALILLNQEGFNSGFDYLGGTTVGWSSSVTLYEHQYKCTIRENEFGYSLNPSLLSGSQSSVPLGTNYVYKDLATGSYFSPYITTVGLYDNDQNLLAIGKLSVPTKVPMNSDLEIQVAFDSI